MITTLEPPIPPQSLAKAAPVAISIKLNNDLLNHFKECLREETRPKLVVKDGIYVSIKGQIRREELREIRRIEERSRIGGHWETLGATRSLEERRQ